MPASSPSSRDQPLGLVGVGLLGTALAERLSAGGFRVMGFDLVPERLADLTRLGGVVAADPADVFRQCDRVLLSLPSHREVTTLFAQHAGGLRAGTVVIDTTTGDPASSETLAAELAVRGVTYLDVTVSGSSAQARAGTAVLMVGGEAAAYAGCADVFAAISADVFRTGVAGTGARMKLATNLVLGLNRAVLAEGLALAEVLGLDLPQTLAVLRSCPAYSRAMDTKGEKMLQRDFSPEARLAQHHKDVRLIVAAGIAAGLPMPLSRAHDRILSEAEAAGFGALDNSAVIEVLRQRTARGGAS